MGHKIKSEAKVCTLCHLYLTYNPTVLNLVTLLTWPDQSLGVVREHEVLPWACVCVGGCTAGFCTGKRGPQGVNKHAHRQTRIHKLSHRQRVIFHHVFQIKFNKCLNIWYSGATKQENAMAWSGVKSLCNAPWQGFSGFHIPPEGSISGDWLKIPTPAQLALRHIPTLPSTNSFHKIVGALKGYGEDTSSLLAWCYLFITSNASHSS